MRGDVVDKTCLSWWFPKVEAAGLPVPKTKILKFEDEQTRAQFFEVFDMKPMGPRAEHFVNKVRAVIKEHFTYPIFLRTGQTSGKHEWDATCFVQKAEDLEHHMLMLIQYSEMADMLGLPWNVWVVREFLKLRHLGTLTEFLNMPLSREWRIFVEDGKVTHIQPYWPVKAMVQGGIETERAREIHLVQQKIGCPIGLYKLSLKAVEACGGGNWSVDWCETETGEWILTDMAEAEQSYRYNADDPEEENLNAQEILPDLLVEKPDGKQDPA